MPALGLLTLAGLTPSPWTCSYQEATSGTDALAADLIQQRPDLVAISALTASIEEAYRFSAALRRHGLRVVLGGLHATACPEEAQRHVDAVVAGEGEPVWVEVLADAARGALRPCIEPRSRSTWPGRLCRASTCWATTAGRASRCRRTRGCPLACEFCGASRLLGAFREKPIDKIRSELAALTHLQTEPLVELADDNTFAGSRDVGALFEALAGAKARYFTEADWRIGERPEVLRGLAGSGCVQVLVGIESLVYRHPGMGPKQTEWPRIRDAILAIQAAGVAVLGCFLVGCDGETLDSLDRLAALIFDSPLADVQLTLQTPFPGTALYRRLKQQGRLLPERGWSFYTLFDVTYQPDVLSVGELEAGFRNLVRQVFSAAAADRRSAIRHQTWRRNPRFQP